MKIKIFPLGIFQANCYILNINEDYLIIDPGAEANKIKENIIGKVCGILITHSHDDHIGALKEIHDEYDCHIYEYDNVFENKIYNVGPFSFKVIYTLGHTLDSITFYFPKEKMMFTGDFLFKGTIGRTDFYNSDTELMLESLKKIITYNDIKIYTGHGDMTTLEQEKEENPYLKKLI